MPRMFCHSCGNQVADGLQFCPNCGQALSAQNPLSNPIPVVWTPPVGVKAEPGRWIGEGWQMVKADGPFVADWCRDYDVSSLNPTPGEVLAKIRYIDMGNCWSVKREDLGFWWKRDPNGWTIKEQ